MTSPNFEGVIHFQKTTGCVIWNDFILDFSSKLKICRLSPATAGTVAFRAITLLAGFIKADSAVIGRLIGVVGEAISTMTTLLLAPVSRIQMNLSDSMVTFVKDMNCWLTPIFGNCSQNKHRRAETL